MSLCWITRSSTRHSFVLTPALTHHFRLTITVTHSHCPSLVQFLGPLLPNAGAKQRLRIRHIVPSAAIALLGYVCASVSVRSEITEADDVSGVSHVCK